MKYLNIVLKTCKYMMTIIFEKLFFGLENKRLKQGYGLLHGINEVDEKEDLTEGLEEYIKVSESPEELIVYQITDICNSYKDYKKISRFKSDLEYESIKN